MVTLYSSPSTHCSSVSQAVASYSKSFIGFYNYHKNLAISSRKFGSKNISLQINQITFCNAVRMQDGAVAVPPSKTEDETPLEKLKDGILLVTPPKELKHTFDFDSNKDKSTVSISVVGASGDLAKKKIFPALFALYYEGCLPEHFTIFGYARSKMTDAELRNMVSKTLTCRIDKRLSNETSALNDFKWRNMIHEDS